LAVDYGMEETRGATQLLKAGQSAFFRQAEISFSTVDFWDPAEFKAALPWLTQSDTLEKPICERLPQVLALLQASVTTSEPPPQPVMQRARSPAAVTVHRVFSIVDSS
jgi:hypothetical protein